MKSQMKALSGSLLKAEVRKRTLRRLLKWLLIFGVLAALDALFIEPYWIQVTRSSVAGRVPAPLKIALLTDLHTSHLGFRERRLLKLLDKEQPDVVVITGDTISGRKSCINTAALLKKLHAPLGVWLVRGNWENSYPCRQERRFYDSVGVHLLLNESTEIRSGIWLVGLDDPASGWPRLSNALANVPADDYRIALFHSPDYFARSAGRYDLALAGHSHGGQVRIPFFKPFWLPPGVGPYVGGWFEQDGSRLYVSRGIGTTFLPIRFFCRPELAIITVEPVVK